MKNIYIFIFFTLIHFFGFNQKTIVVGPQNDCATKKISRNIHTSSAYLEIGNSTKLKITTLQHRTYDASRIYDQNGKVIWEWRGESRSDTWYTKEHLLTVNCSQIKIEFTQGYSDPFCNGYIKVEVMDDFKNSQQNVSEIQTTEISNSNIEDVKSEKHDFGISEITFVEIGNSTYKRFPDEEIFENKLNKSLCYTIGNYLKNTKLYDSLLGNANVINRLSELICIKLNVDGKKELSPLVFSAIKRTVTNVTMEYFKGMTNLQVISWYSKIYMDNYKSFIGFGCDTPVIEVQAYPFDWQEKNRQEDLQRQAALTNGNYENGARNYCISTSSNKYVLSLFDDGSKKVIYKMYDINGNLNKTIQGVWEINNEGVYGSAYILKTSWTGSNSGMPSLRFTCQYYAGGELQSIIDSQNRTWYECE